MKLDFAVGTNRDERMDEVAGHARVAEESGFRFVTFVDQPFMSRDVFASMTIAAQNTNRIHFGPGVFDLTTHHPLAMVEMLGNAQPAQFLYATGDLLRSAGQAEELPASPTDHLGPVVLVASSPPGGEGVVVHDQGVGQTRVVRVQPLTQLRKFGSRIPKGPLHVFEACHMGIRSAERLLCGSARVDDSARTPMSMSHRRRPAFRAPLVDEFQPPPDVFRMNTEEDDAVGQLSRQLASSGTASTAMYTGSGFATHCERMRPPFHSTSFPDV